MTNQVKLYRYSLPSVRGEGWAIIVIGSDGYFSAISDWGNYAYLWSNHGCNDFREFLLRAEKDWDYFVNKLNPKREYDGQATLKAIKEGIIERRKNKESSFDKEAARTELNLLSDHGNLHHQEQFDEWLKETTLRGAYEYYQDRPDQQTVSFVKLTMAGLATLIKEELAREAKQP